jgi:hypothetical protein
MPSLHLYAVDRVHDPDAVLVDDTGRAVTLALDRLPPGIAVGTVLRVAVDEAGTAEWESAVIDEEETERRRKKSAELTERLRHSGPHGFIDPQG